jgi:imidazolonepropionase-like amidohydrolase
VPVLAQECWRHLDLLKRAKLPAILSGPVEFTYTHPVTEKKQTICPAALLEKAGVPFALTTRETGDLLQANPFYGAALAVRNGVSRAAALQAMTTVPAGMLGLGKRLGSLEKGKDGNLIVLTGDPLDTMTMLEKVIIEGTVAYSRDADPVLKEVVAREKERARKAAEEKKKKAAAKKAQAKKSASAKKAQGGDK